MLEASPVETGLANGEVVYRHGICCTASGAGDAVVLLHGVGMNKAAWHPQLAALSADYRVLALDLPGHGGSDPLPPDATLVHYTDAILRFMDAWKCEQASLVGHSMGSLVALGIALDHPDRVKRLAALNAVYDRDAPSRRAVNERAQEIVELGATSNLESNLLRWFGDTDIRSEAAGKVRAWLEATPQQGYATAYRVFATSDRAFLGRLGALRPPALFMTGELDPNSTPEMSRRMAAEAPCAAAIVVPGQRHMMNLTVPDEVNAILASFLSA